MIHKIDSFKELFEQVKSLPIQYHKAIKNNGGYDDHLRAVAAQSLWLLLLAKIVFIFLPNINSLTSGAIIVAIGAVINIIGFLTNGIIPNVIADFIKGKFFYGYGSSLLLWLILFLCGIHFIWIFYVYYFHFTVNKISRFIYGK